MNYQTNIKELREQKGLSQEELSEASGVSLRTIQRIENGEGTPRESTLNTIAESLNVTSDYLIYNPLEVVTEEVEIKNKVPKKSFRFPWYRFGLTLIGGSLGFIFIVFVEATYLDKIDSLIHTGEVLYLPSIIIFSTIGLLIGNFIDKRNS